MSRPHDPSPVAEHKDVPAKCLPPAQGCEPFATFRFYWPEHKEFKMNANVCQQTFLQPTNQPTNQPINQTDRFFVTRLLECHTPSWLWLKGVELPKGGGEIAISHPKWGMCKAFYMPELVLERTESRADFDDPTLQTFITYQRKSTMPVYRPPSPMPAVAL